MSLTAKKLASEIKVTQYDFDPNSTSATAVGWVAMKDFGKLMVSFFRTIGTSTVTLAIKAATDSSGTNATTVVSKTISDQPDAVGDYIFLECIASQIAQIGTDNSLALTHASAYVSFATATDEGVVTYIQGSPSFAYDGLTADYVS